MRQAAARTEASALRPNDRTEEIEVTHYSALRATTAHGTHRSSRTTAQLVYLLMELKLKRAA
jgi:hypothetical protein